MMHVNNKKTKRLSYTKSCKQGFSLIELIVVMAIMAILVLLAAPKYLNYVKDAEVIAMEADIRLIEDIVERGRIEDPDGGWPVTDNEPDLSDESKDAIVDEYVDAVGGEDYPKTEDGEPDKDEIVRQSGMKPMDPSKIKDETKNTKNAPDDYVIATEGPLEGKVYHKDGYEDSDGNYYNNLPTINKLDPIIEEDFSANSIVEISNGNEHTLALTSAGDVYVWGNNKYGQIGNGTKGGTLPPVKVEKLNDIKAVSAGGHHSLALTKTGEVYAWGMNSSMEVGDGVSGPVLEPKKVDGLSDIKAISTGDKHSLALTVSGDVYAWGRNDVGQIGNGTENFGNGYNSGVIKVGLSNIKEISCGYETSLALTNDGKVFSWGSAQFTDDAFDKNSNIPRQKFGLNNIKGVFGAGRTSYAINESGEVYAWGYNGYGTFGNGKINDTTRSTLIKMNNLNNVKTIAGGPHHTVALTESGDVYAWGNNWYGQLGNDTTEDSYLPIKLNNFKNVKAIGGGGFNSSIITETREVYFWGNNEPYRINNVKESILTPIKILFPE